MNMPNLSCVHHAMRSARCSGVSLEMFLGSSGYSSPAEAASVAAQTAAVLRGLLEKM